MKKGSKKVSNITRTLEFFRSGDDNEVRAVLMLMVPVINERKLAGVGAAIKEPQPIKRARRASKVYTTSAPAPVRRLNGADEVETHKERVAHALAATQGEE
jgi:hypothetical protein